jgi:hypothetical protein
MSLFLNNLMDRTKALLYMLPILQTAIATIIVLSAVMTRKKGTGFSGMMMPK